MCIFLLEIHLCGIGVLQIRTVCVTWPFLAISYASVTDYSKTQCWKRETLLLSKVSVFSQWFFFSILRRGPFPTVHCILFFFPLIFPITSTLSIPYDCWWRCFPDVCRLTASVKDFLMVSLFTKGKKRRIAWVWFVIVWRPKALPKGCSLPRQKDLVSEV